MPFRRRFAALIVASIATALAPAVSDASVVAPFPAPNWIDTFGAVALSSPTVATINGVTALVFGSENGYVDVVDAATGLNLPGWPQPVSFPGGGPSPIESTPTVAHLDGPSKPPTIIVGTGSTYVANTIGGLIAFRADGTVRFRFATQDVFNEWTGGNTPDGYDEAVYATPAVGDITGNGQQDIVFGSWDHHLYALRPDGTLVPGFPLDTQDTIWSSPALFHVRGPKRQVDIFTGGDASGRDGCFGGFVYDVSYKHHAPKIEWQHCENQTIWSSPAVGVINATGRPAVVVGTGFGEKPPYKSDTDRVFAFYARGGATVPGWPVHTSGPVFGSPAIGQLTPGGPPVIVDTAWCLACTTPASGLSTLYEWNGAGQLIWQTALLGSQDFSSPTLVDLTGGGVTDVLVGSSAGLYPIDGSTGAFLYGTSMTSAINSCSMQNAPAVAYVNGVGQSAGWHAFETCGGPQQLTPTGRLFSYPLPAVPATTPPWPMWRASQNHLGVSITDP
ncbi:MAG TPA: hypothetical protein VG368_04240 [Acidimicrobiales bacterium]|jgi:hypothetical protein|nr:hypothetical protein [Acidimicrobiales bacterium]